VDVVWLQGSCNSCLAVLKPMLNFRRGYDLVGHWPSSM
jgi:hypothetical protein